MKATCKKCGALLTVKDKQIREFSEQTKIEEALKYCLECAVWVTAALIPPCPVELDFIPEKSMLKNEF